MISKSSLIGISILILGLTSVCKADFWDLVKDKDYSIRAPSKSEEGCESGMGACELEEEKNIKKELFLELAGDLPLQFSGSDHLSELAQGKIYVGHNQLSVEQFRENFASLPTLQNHALFNGSVVSILSGVFVTNTKPNEYHHPDQILSQERIEKTVRKMSFIEKTGDFQIKASKLVKFMRWKFHIPFTIEAAWFFHPDQVWMGSEENRLNQDEMKFLTAHVKGTIIHEQERLTHSVQIFSYAEDAYLRGATTFIVSFLSPDQKHALVCFWQFVAANDLVVMKFLNWIPYVRDSIAAKFKTTALRDFARNVDVICSK